MQVPSVNNAAMQNIPVRFKSDNVEREWQVFFILFSQPGFGFAVSYLTRVIYHKAETT